MPPKRAPYFRLMNNVDGHQSTRLLYDLSSGSWRQYGISIRFGCFIFGTLYGCMPYKPLLAVLYVIMYLLNNIILNEFTHYLPMSIGASKQVWPRNFGTGSLLQIQRAAIRQSINTIFVIEIESDSYRIRSLNLI